MKKIVFIIILIYSSMLFVAKAQTPKIDSLENILNEHTIQDTVRINLLNEIAFQLSRKDIEKSLKYAIQANELANKLDFEKGKAKSLKLLGVYYANKSDYTKALEYYQKSLDIYIEIYSKIGISKCYNKIAVIYMYQSDYSKSLEYFQKALKTNEELGNKREMATSYNNIGIVYDNEGDYPKALMSYQKALKIDEELGDKRGVAVCNGNIGIIYKEQKDYDKALEYFQKTLEISIEIEDQIIISICYNNIGAIYKEQDEYNKALEYYQKALKIKEELGSKNGIAHSYNNIGNIYKYLGDYDKAHEYIQKSLEICLEIGSKSIEASCYMELSLLYFKQNKIKESYNYGKKSYTLAKEIGDVNKLKISSKTLAQCSEKLGLYKQAYEYHVIYKTMEDSLYNEENLKKITGLEYEYKYEKEKLDIKLIQDKKDLQAKEESKRQQIFKYIFGIGIIILLIIAIIIYRYYKIKQKANILLADKNEEILQQKEEITQQSEESLVQHKIVLKQKKQIIDSIQYAMRIQLAALPSEEYISKFLNNYFILFKPRDIVSGDFYWVKQIKNNTIIAVADCTGHGVPGALISMLGISFLNEIVRRSEIIKSNQLLESLRTEIKIALKQHGKQNDLQEGMDIALCIINNDTMKLQFSGANNPLYLIRNNELLITKPTKNPIGIYLKEKPFVNNVIDIQKDDIIYMFSDGYVDQFGSENRKKFMTRNFKTLLLSIAEKPMQEQHEILNKTFEDWRGEVQQTDDVLVMGIKI